VALLSGLVVVVLLQLLLFWLDVSGGTSYFLSTAAGAAALYAANRGKTGAKATGQIPEDRGPQSGDQLC
jgi:hypothetical protein